MGRNMILFWSEAELRTAWEADPHVVHPHPNPQREGVVRLRSLHTGNHLTFLLILVAFATLAQINKAPHPGPVASYLKFYSSPS